MTTEQLVSSARGSRTGGTNAPRVIAIGAGFGGLAAAVRLAANGYRVKILEARSQAGGRAGQIVDQGFTFDTGPTLITAPELLNDLWRVAGKRLPDYVDLRPLDPYYRVQFKDGQFFEYSGDSKRFERELAKFNLADVEGYRRFLDAAGDIYQRAFVDLGRQPFHRARSYLRVVPELIQLGGLRSVYDVVAGYIKDPHLRTVLSFHPLFIGGNPFRASAIYSIVPYLEKQGGVHFATGGMHSVIKGMVALLEELGGELCLNTPVHEIVMKEQRVLGVETERETFEPADIVVANSDAATTLLRLVPESNRSWFWSHYWNRSRYSMSCYIFYFGVSRQYPGLRHHTIVMPEDFRKVVGEIFDTKRVPSDIPLYIHMPTRTDPTMAPEGCESVYALVPVPNLTSGIEWDLIGDGLRERVINILEHTIGLADFRNAITVEHRMTPVDFRDELGSWLGAAFSIEPTLMQSAYFRPHNKVTEVDGLYLVGAGTHPGAGVPGVLLSAEITSGLISADVPVSGLANRPVH